MRHAKEQYYERMQQKTDEKLASAVDISGYFIGKAVENRMQGKLGRIAGKAVRSNSVSRGLLQIALSFLLLAVVVDNSIGQSRFTVSDFQDPRAKNPHYNLDVLGTESDIPYYINYYIDKDMNDDYIKHILPEARKDIFEYPAVSLSVKEFILNGKSKEDFDSLIKEVDSIDTKVFRLLNNTRYKIPVDTTLSDAQYIQWLNQYVSWFKQLKYPDVGNVYIGVEFFQLIVDDKIKPEEQVKPEELANVLIAASLLARSEHFETNTPRKDLTKITEQIRYVRMIDNSTIGKLLVYGGYLEYPAELDGWVKNENEHIYIPVPPLYWTDEDIKVLGYLLSWLDAMQVKSPFYGSAARAVIAKVKKSKKEGNNNVLVVDSESDKALLEYEIVSMSDKKNAEAAIRFAESSFPPYDNKYRTPKEKNGWIRNARMAIGIAGETGDSRLANKLVNFLDYYNNLASKEWYQVEVYRDSILMAVKTENSSKYLKASKILDRFYDVRISEDYSKMTLYRKHDYQEEFFFDAINIALKSNDSRFQGVMQKTMNNPGIQLSCRLSAAIKYYKLEGCTLDEYVNGLLRIYIDLDKQVPQEPDVVGYRIRSILFDMGETAVPIMLKRLDNIIFELVTINGSNEGKRAELESDITIISGMFRFWSEKYVVMDLLQGLIEDKLTAEQIQILDHSADSEILKKRLKNKLEEVKLSILRYADNTPYPWSAKTLFLDLLSAENVNMRLYAGELLIGVFGNDEEIANRVIATADRSLSDKEPKVRIQVARVYAKSGKFVPIKGMKTLLKDTNEDVVDAALCAAKELNDKRLSKTVNEVIKKRVASPNPCQK